MKEDEEEEKNFRNSIPYGKRIKNCLNNYKEDIRARSSSLANCLFQNFIPKLKPINTNLNPSPIKLGKKEVIKIDEKNFDLIPKKISNKKLKFNINNIEEEINENVVNSEDEKYYNKLSNISDSSKNESKHNDKIDNNIIKIKKNVKNYINHIKKKFDKYKNDIDIKKFIDDTDILNLSYKKYFIENYKVKCAQNYINKLLEKKDDYNKTKNKTISFQESKKFKPPILGYLQMNEESRSTTLSP